MARREQILKSVVDRVLGLRCDHVVKVGIDGVDGAGKTAFADELANVLQSSGRPIIRASVDGFHNSKTMRYARGRSSPEGFFADSYDYAALRSALLDPLSSGGSGRYRVAVFDHRSDSPVAEPERDAAPTSILVFDGIFLHRPELRACWDFSVFLNVAFAISVSRCAERDGTSPDPTAAGNHRYVQGQRLYLQSCAPSLHATVTIDNNDLAMPFLVPTPKLAQ